MKVFINFSDVRVCFKSARTNLWGSGSHRYDLCSHSKASPNTAQIALYANTWVWRVKSIVCLPPSFRNKFICFTWYRFFLWWTSRKCLRNANYFCIETKDIKKKKCETVLRDYLLLYDKNWLNKPLYTLFVLYY